jgi:hypothetical protein
MTDESFHVRLVSRYGPNVFVSRDLILVDEFIKNNLARESIKDIFVVYVKEKVIRQIPGTVYNKERP